MVGPIFTFLYFDSRMLKNVWEFFLWICFHAINLSFLFFFNLKYWWKWYWIMPIIQALKTILWSNVCFLLPFFHTVWIKQYLTVSVILDNQNGSSKDEINSLVQLIKTAFIKKCMRSHFIRGVIKQYLVRVMSVFHDFI